MPAMTTSGAVQAELPITTAMELPGVRIAENLGLCFGLIVRSMGVARGFTASLSALRAGGWRSTPRCSRTRGATRSIA